MKYIVKTTTAAGTTSFETNEVKIAIEVFDRQSRLLRTGDAKDVTLQGVPIEVNPLFAKAIQEIAEKW